MKIQNQLISVRNRILDIISRSNPDSVFNNSDLGDLMSGGEDPSARLHLSIQELLTSAMDDNAQVDYLGLRRSSAYAEYQKRSTSLQTFDPTSFVTREEKMAFWINLYNTLILEAVINLDIKRSVTERFAGIGFFRKAAYLVNGKRVSCDDIEHGILRANRGHPYLGARQFRSDDPRSEWMIDPIDVRIHFALNYASRSCPPIRAYTAENLEEQLDMAAGNFVSQEVEINPRDNSIELSTIFKWFSGDFGGQKGVIAFILKYFPDDELKAWLKSNGQNARLKYKPYDWGLNGRSH